MDHSFDPVPGMRQDVAPTLAETLWPDDDEVDEDSDLQAREGEVELWRFVIVAPPHHDEPVVRFNLAIPSQIADMLRDEPPDHDQFAWGCLLEEVDDMANRKVEEAL